MMLATSLALALTLAPWGARGAASSPTEDPTSPDAPTLQWSAPAGCPTQPQMRARLDAALPEGTQAAGWRFDVTQDAAGWQLSWHEPGAPEPPRTAQAQDCAALAEAAIVIIVIAATEGQEMPADQVETPPASEDPPAATVPAPAPEPVPAPEPAPAPEPEPEPEPEPAAPSARARPTVAGLVVAGAGLGIATTEATTGTFTVQAGVTARRWSVTLGAGHHLFRTRDLAVDAQARAWLTSVDLRGCGHPLAGRYELALCGGLSGGAATARGIAVRNPRQARAPWLALRASAIFRVWVVEAFGLFVGAEPLVPLVRPNLVVEGLGPACCGTAVGFEAHGGITARIGRRGQRR